MNRQGESVVRERGLILIEVIRTFLRDKIVVTTRVRCLPSADECCIQGEERRWSQERNGKEDGPERVSIRQVQLQTPFYDYNVLAVYS